MNFNIFLCKIKGNVISAFDRTRIVALNDEGLSKHQIANRLGILRETDTVVRRRETERPGLTSESEDRFVAYFM